MKRFHLVPLPLCLFLLLTAVLSLLSGLALAEAAFPYDGSVLLDGEPLASVTTLSSFDDHTLSYVAAKDTPKPIFRLESDAWSQSPYRDLLPSADGEATYHFRCPAQPKPVRIIFYYYDSALDYWHESIPHTVTIQDMPAAGGLELTAERTTLQTGESVHMILNKPIDEAKLYYFFGEECAHPDTYLLGYFTFTIDPAKQQAYCNISGFEKPQTGYLCAITPDGRRSNVLKLTWTSQGELAEVTNIRLNGEPLENWKDRLTADIPYTITFDPVPNATYYAVMSDDHMNGLIIPASASPSGLILFDSTASSAKINTIQAIAVGWSTSSTPEVSFGAAKKAERGNNTLSVDRDSSNTKELLNFRLASVTGTHAMLCCYSTTYQNFAVVPMENSYYGQPALAAAYPHLGADSYTYWAVNDQGQVSNKLTVAWTWGEAARHEYPSGTPTIQLTPYQTTMKVGEYVSLSTDCTYYNTVFWADDANGCRRLQSWNDAGACSDVRAEAAGEIRVWAEAPNGEFSNMVTLTCTSRGALTAPSSIRINGVAIESWTETLVAGVPYDITFDDVPYATQYELEYKYLNGQICDSAWLKSTRSQFTLTVPTAADACVLTTIRATSSVYDTAQSPAYALGPVRAAEQPALVLQTNASATSTNVEPFTFTVASTAEAAYLCYYEDTYPGQIKTLAMQKHGDLFMLTPSVCFYDGTWHFWAADSSHAVSPKMTLKCDTPYPAHSGSYYPDGTPWLTLTASSDREMIGDIIEFQVSSEAKSVDFIYEYEMDGQFYRNSWSSTFDAATSTYTCIMMQEHSSSGRVWAKDSDGYFSNAIDVEWTSLGKLAPAANIRINGTPIAEWSGGIVARVPFTVTFDPVPNATGYEINGWSSNDHCFNYTRTDSTGTQSLQLVFENPAAEASIGGIHAYGNDGWEESDTDRIPLGAVTQNTQTSLTLAASALSGSMKNPISLSVPSSAESATLCCRKENGESTMVLMGYQNGCFLASFPNLDSSSYTVWAADSNGAVSQELTIEWITETSDVPEGSLYPEGTPTLTLTSSASSLVYGQEVEFLVSSQANFVTLHYAPRDLYGAYQTRGMERVGTSNTFACPLYGSNVEYTVDIWAEDSDGYFSNKLVMKTTALGTLENPTNIKLNGIPLADWRGALFAGVPYTLSFEPVEHATEYDVSYDDGDIYCSYTWSAAEHSSCQIVFREPTGLATLNFFSFSEDYFSTTSLDVDLAPVVASVEAPLALQSSSESGSASCPVIFTMKGDAAEATLCLQRHGYASIFVPMQKKDGVFTAALSSLPSLDQYTVWAADSSNAVSNEITLHWGGVSSAAVTSFSVADTIILYPNYRYFIPHVYDIEPSGLQTDAFTWHMDGEEDTVGLMRTITPTAYPSVRKLTVTAQSGVSREVTVITIFSEGISTALLPEQRLKLGSVLDPQPVLTLNDVPYERYSDEFIIRSSAPEIITVKGGLLYAAAPGEATITLRFQPKDDRHEPNATSIMLHLTVYDASELVLPAALKEVGAEAFAGSAAAIVRIPAGCTSLGSRAFAACTALREVHIPASVEHIAADAFSGSAGVTLFGPAGSIAQTFAAAQGLPFTAE